MLHEICSNSKDWQNIHSQINSISGRIKDLPKDQRDEIKYQINSLTVQIANRNFHDAENPALYITPKLAQIIIDRINDMIGGAQNSLKN